MYLLTKMLKRIWAIWFMIIFGSFLIVLFPLFWLLLSNRAFHPMANKLRRLWAYWIVTFTGVDYKTEIETVLDKNQQYIFCANHASILDIPYFAIIWNDYFKFMAKIEFSKIIFFGHFFKTIDIPVDRNSKISSFKAYKKAIEDIEKGYSIIIFPEGTSERNPPELIEFKNGPFKIAIDKQIPIVPVTFLDNWHLFHWHGDFTGNPGTSRVILHAPIETKGLSETDVERIKNETFNTINNTLIKEYGSKQAVGR
jgi:1-acyl-sn-glycerol-3-phosphate acyltransferase